MVKRTKRPPETFNGAIGAIPHVVLDGLAFTGATDKAKALLFPFMRQINGRNNGHMHLAPQWLKKQGYTSSTIYSARDELIDRGLIIQTRYGGLDIGASLYAVTWLAITNFIGLDITETGYHRGAWALCELPPTLRRKPPQKKREKLYDDRSSATTTTVAENKPPTTTTVAGNPLLATSPTTTTVNNVFNTNTPSSHRKRIVGVKGKSGKAKHSLHAAQTDVAPA